MAESAADPEFSTADAAELAGVQLSTLQQWIGRRFIDLPPGPGTGRSRLLTFAETVQIAIVGQLVKDGMSVRAAAGMAENVEEPFDGHLILWDRDPPSTDPRRHGMEVRAEYLHQPDTLKALTEFRDRHARPDAVFSLHLVNVAAIAKRVRRLKTARKL